MAERIYKDGEKYSLWSTVSDSWILWNVGEEDILSHMRARAILQSDRNTKRDLLKAHTLSEEQKQWLARLDQLEDELTKAARSSQDGEDVEEDEDE